MVAGRTPLPSKKQPCCLSVSTCRRYINSYQEDDLEGLYDSKLTRESRLKASVDEVICVAESYTWVNNTLQAAESEHIARDERVLRLNKVLMLLQDGSIH